MSRRVLAALGLSILGSVGFVFAYAGAGPQLQGASLAVALGGLGSALALWSKGLMPHAPAVQERHPSSSPAREQVAAAGEFSAGEQQIGRRRLLGRAFALAAAALGATLLVPLRSLGPRPASGLRQTGWAPGVRVVDVDGLPVPVEALQVGGVLTVFPERHTGAADAQVILLRVNASDLPAGIADWAPLGYIAYSKVCTHAGCPVGLYNQRAHVLICPCHQASFDALTGAQPTFGPAPRPLPQLPLGVTGDGFLVAVDDFTAPVGPARWRTASA